jgi:hypothetical protein
MTALSKTLHPDEKIKAGKLGSNMAKVGIGVAVLFLGLSVLFVLIGSDTKTLEAGHVSTWSRFLHAYVVGWAFVASVPIGMLWLVLLHFLVRGRWATAVRRICEAMTGSFTLVWIAGLVFVLPVLFGYEDLYYWANPAAHDAVLNPTLAHKLGWLSPVAFSIRYVIYGALYIGISSYFAKKSREQDESGDPKITDHLRVVSGPGMIIYAFVTCLVGFDVLMSLAPKWYSTIYGVGFWGSACVGAFATLALVVLWIQRSGRLVHSITEEHYHDIGKWLFSFTFFWAYTAFSQFMLQWYGNMPEETVWYKYRMFGDWQWVSIAILVGYWAFPFVFLLSRWTKRIVPALVFFAVWQLVFHWLDLYWNVMPNFDWEVVHHGATAINAGPLMGNVNLHHVGFSPVDITVWLGLIGVLLAGIGRGLTGNLIPTKDPTLGMSLAHEQL